MVDTLTKLPQRLTAGDAWAWVETLDNYPAPTWTLTYYFRGPQYFEIISTPSGSAHALAVPAATSGEYLPGQYHWLARAVNGPDVWTVNRGFLTVDANLAKSGLEYRDFWQRTRDALKAVIENRATTDQQSMSIGGRSLSRMSWDELLRAYDMAVYRAEQELGARPGTVFVRFGQP